MRRHLPLIIIAAIVLAGAVFYLVVDPDLSARPDAHQEQEVDLSQVRIERASASGGEGGAGDAEGETNRSAGDEPGADGAPSAPGSSPQGEGPRPDPQGVAEAAAAASGRGTPGGQPSASEADIRESIDRVKPLVKGCYETLLDEFPEAEGRVVVRMKVRNIEGIGEVELVQIGEGTELFDEKMHGCLGQAMELVTFPIDGLEGDEVVVTYPYQFQKAP